ncbi:MAG: SRPBCC family protein [Spirosomataceae bacterium]
MNQKITIATTVNAPINKVWDYWTTPAHIMQWNNASDDWHTPSATNDLQVGGSFTYQMAAKDGSFSFDFGGIYDAVVPHEQIAYTIADGRKVKIDFIPEGDSVKVIEEFEAENENPIEMQQMGWQAILDNFKKYTEKN